MNIAIAGYGTEGKSNYTHWNTSDNTLTIVDEREILEDLPENVVTILGPGAFEKLDGFDLIIRTAGLAPHKIKTDGKIWSATNEFFARCPAQIIGVTGTKGKGTTSSLIASILRAADKNVHLLGNIGTPALEELPKITADDIVVFELSSFQLWDIEKSPHIAVVLMIEPDHLNVHFNFDDYVNAKANIRRYQTGEDVCIYHPTNTYSRQIAQSSKSGKAIRYSVSEDGGVYITDNMFKQNEQNICSIDELQLLGKHNQENACAAISVAKELGISNEAITTGLRDFKGLPHRLEFVRELDGVSYYNDSFSSAPGATIAAIQSFTQPEIVIIGGIEKGADFSELKTALVAASNIKKIILIGEIRHKLASILNDSDIIVSDATTMDQVIDEAREQAQPGDVIVLSPACASFDMFKNFYDRGDQFRTIVQAL